MDYLLIGVVSFLASALTLFSGFGLGTLLMPVFALFFPLPAAIAMTALVHFLNNLLKLTLFVRHADWKVVLRFGLPALVAAFAGAWCLHFLSDLAPWFQYSWAGREFSVLPVNLIVSVLLLVFVFFELLPATKDFAFPQKFLSLGGVLSGFIGGISGHQGALRGAFLIKCGLSKESYIATGVVIACLVDASRLTVYGSQFTETAYLENFALLVVAIASAFAGVILGRMLLKKITLRFIQMTVSIFLIGIALGLGVGLLG